MSSESWKEISVKAREKLYASIPSEWRIPKDKLPPPEQLDVTDFPAKSGILTEAEIAITESFATDIVKKVAFGEWSAEDVTRAFCKRAAIAHQLVRKRRDNKIKRIANINGADQLSYRDHV